MQLKSLLYNEILIHYRKYSDTNMLIDYSEFSKFFSDFEIFPNVLNIIQMKTIYYSMHELFLQELKSEEILNKNYLNVKKNLKINYEYFLESLFLSSSFIKTNQELNSVEKIVYLISKMGSSKAIKKIQNKSRENRY